jgi:hypothetical protein
MIFFLIKNQTMKIKNIGRLNKIYYLNWLIYMRLRGHNLTKNNYMTKIKPKI